MSQVSAHYSQSVNVALCEFKTWELALGLIPDQLAHPLSLGTWYHWTGTLLTLKQKHSIIRTQQNIGPSNIRWSRISFSLVNNIFTCANTSKLGSCFLRSMFDVFGLGETKLIQVWWWLVKFTNINITSPVVMLLNRIEDTNWSQISSAC